MKTLPTLGLMLLLLVTMASAELDIVGVYDTDGNFTFDYAVYDDGVLVNATCNWEVGNLSGTGVVNQRLPDDNYHYKMYCTHNSGNVTTGGYTSYDFTIYPSTIFGGWKPVENWTYPVIYLLLTILLILFAFTYESSLLGVLGSLMLMFSYFIIGATSPILFAPLLIVGFLLSIRFSWM